MATNEDTTQIAMSDFWKPLATVRGNANPVAMLKYAARHSGHLGIKNSVQVGINHPATA